MNIQPMCLFLQVVQVLNSYEIVIVYYAMRPRECIENYPCVKQVVQTCDASTGKLVRSGNLIIKKQRARYQPLSTNIQLHEMIK